MSGLFEAAAEERLRSRAPLAARLRPRTLDEVVGQRHLVGPGAPLRVLVERDRLSSVVLWGPPGSGKTTLARLVAQTTSKEMVSLSAVTAGVKDVREVIEGARRRLGEQHRGTILFVDEVHRFNKAQQDVLLPAVEEGLVVLVGATTENPFFEVNPPLMSRATLWRLEPIGDEDMAVLVRRGLDAEGAAADDDVVRAMVGAAEGDARSALTTVEVAVALASARPPAGVPSPSGRIGVTIADVAAARAGRLYHQGVDEHYDQVSALIKSVRGSDPDAGLYWLARMLDAGEDARFIARRLVILSSEDVGMADPQALVVADAAARAVEMVGLPEAALNLAHAVVYLACAPKSNRVTVALSRARDDVRSGAPSAVPQHLRDAHYRSAGTIGHGVGYRYPHDSAEGWVDQPYRPDALEGHVYYEPSPHGAEQQVAERLWRLRRRETPSEQHP
ncbi:MAG: replication-associated recombination protein A [Actinomycetota bacterium]|nr:replication-associated recombination protein A [Actinomycetota bacterium]